MKAMKSAKPAKGCIPAGFADGGKIFGNKESKKEEMNEAKSVRSGKLTPAAYAKGEKKEGEKDSMASLKSRGAALKTGKMTPAAYAATESKPKKK